jgi:hypothetical protein
MGYECIQENCQYDGKSDRFFVRILASWKDVQADAPYTVTIDGELVRYTTSFSAAQTTDVQTIRAMSQGMALGLAATPEIWTLMLEELIPRDVEETEDPTEPFDLVVRRGITEECFGGCRWTLHSRQDTQEGLKKVRMALALTRSVTKNG